MLAREVEVLWDGRWLPGRIINAEKGSGVVSNVVVEMDPVLFAVLPRSLVVSPDSRGTTWRFKGDAASPGDAAVDITPAP